MYVKSARRRGSLRLVLVSWAATSLLAGSPRSAAQAQQPNGVVLNLSQATERLEMTVNTSQILTLSSRIPRIVVNNPELVTATPLSETQVQIAARKPGVTQVNLWDEKGQIYSVDLLIFGDVRELEVNLKRMFPTSSLKVIRLTNSLVLEGQVDRPEIVSTIRTLAEDYAPKVINNITVGGAQQVLLKVKVMEVNRTKARAAGFDFDLSGTSGFLTSSAAGILTNIDRTENTFTAPRSTINFDIIDGNTQFLGVLEALQQRNLIKTLANPTLVTVSGRPASFNAGGEIFFQINNGISGSTVESEKFGTQVDFVPIVLGNGRIRLEVRPKISDIDNTAELGNELFRTRSSEVDTGVEMQAGQTLALAGLIQTKVNSQKRGLPYLSDLPYVGNLFGGVRDENEEVELLILVTPEFAEAMDPHEAPPCGPGMETMSPSDCDLYLKGHIETPACGPCGASDPCFCNAPGLDCQTGNCGPVPYAGMAPVGPAVMATDGSGMMMPSAPVQVTPTAPMPNEQGWTPQAPPGRQPLHLAARPARATNRPQPQPQLTATAASPLDRSGVPGGAPALVPANRPTTTPGLIGPIGYDVQK
ncbi:MAG: hypothetical protein DCC67_11830 [Planctomycetota bacterium]|nr:MAG: hypothetical protein DCC67_11830 [Planctomycetota bacterium]